MKVLIRAKGSRNLLLYYIDANGREVSKTSGTRNKGEAERAAALWEQELIAFRGTNGDGWGYFRKRFEDEHLATLSSKGDAAYGTALNHYERVMSPALISEVTPDSISAFKAKMLGEEKKLSSISTHLRHLRMAFGWAAEIGMIPKFKVKIPKQTARKFMRGRPITEAEYEKMLKACPDACWSRFLRLLWLSGMRLEEATRFSWDTPPIVARMDARPFPTIMFYAEGHKAGSDEMSPMAPDLHAWLSAVSESERAGPVVALPVLPNEASRVISGIGKACKIAVNETKFASAHDIRRAFGSRWAKVVRPLTLQKMMRHRDFTTTLKYYVGLEAEDAGAELWSVPTTVPKQGQKPKKAGPKK